MTLFFLAFQNFTLSTIKFQNKNRKCEGNIEVYFSTALFHPLNCQVHQKRIVFLLIPGFLCTIINNKPKKQTENEN